MSAPGFAAIVKANWRNTTGYLVTADEPCITVARDELREVERRLELVDLADVGRLRPSGSWSMAVIVCRGDDLRALAAWARQRDARRVHFYLHSGASAAQLAPWRDAGLPLDHVDEGIRSWRSLHKVLGWDLNVMVYEDHRRL
jgi:hypothetical protein